MIVAKNLTDIATQLVKDFRNDQVQQGALAPLTIYNSDLNEVERETVQAEIRKQLGNEDAFEKMVASLGGQAFLQTRTIEPGKGADTAAIAPAGTDKVIATRVKESAKAALVADDKTPQDSFSTLEDMLKDTTEDAAQLQAMTADMSPADRKAMDASLGNLDKAGTKALSDVGRYQLAMAKALRVINKNPDTAEANKAKLFGDMQQMVAKMAVDQLDMTPDWMTKQGLPADTDPALVRAAIMGDPAAQDKLGQMAAAAGPGSAAKSEREKQAEGEVHRAGSIMALLASNAPIDDLLVAVMMLMMDDNDENLRQRMAEMDRAKADASRMRKDRAMASSSDIANKRIELQKTQEQLAIAKATPPGAVTSATTVSTSTTTTVSTTVASTTSAPAAEAGAGATAAPAAATPAAATPAAATPAAATPAAATPAAATPAAATPAAATPAASVDQAKGDTDTAALQAKVDRLSAEIDANTATTSNMDEQIDAKQSAMDKLSFEIQQLVDRRKNMFEMISKILNVFSTMMQTVTQNIGR